MSARVGLVLYEELVEKQIEHKAKPIALFCLETCSKCSYIVHCIPVAHKKAVLLLI